MQCIESNVCKCNLFNPCRSKSKIFNKNLVKLSHELNFEWILKCYHGPCFPEKLWTLPTQEKFRLILINCEDDFCFVFVKTFWLETKIEIWTLKILTWVSPLHPPSVWAAPLFCGHSEAEWPANTSKILLRIFPASDDDHECRRCKKRIVRRNLREMRINLVVNYLIGLHL